MQSPGTSRALCRIVESWLVAMPQNRWGDMRDKFSQCSVTASGSNGDDGDGGSDWVTARHSHHTANPSCCDMASYVLRQKIVIRRASIRYCVGGGEAENEAYDCVCGGGIERQWQKADSGSSEKLNDELYAILYSEDFWPYIEALRALISSDNSTAIIRYLLPNSSTRVCNLHAQGPPLQTARPRPRRDTAE
ncbi:hypothetical protein Q9L58_006951 [Maublancomyces gigas]|uniref:Uncharacterized protein n=1 Tax=Discina gigas TaxID=1032678 RepID=A0ABR3GDZ8_9PEZI